MLMTEERLQTAYVQWLKMHPDKPLFHSIPNEQRYRGKGAAIAGHRLNQMGRLSGVADIFIAEPRGFCGGMYVELKAKGGRQSASQKAFAERAIRNGYHYICCDNLDELISQTNSYLMSQFAQCR